MTEVSKLMKTNADGTESQVYPETHLEAVVGLDGYIATHGGSGGNQSAEVAAARGKYETLGIREDAQDNAIIAAQSTADSKFDTNQAESYFKSITALPETFANLAAIKAKYPSGKNGLMVAADNGHKYVWSNGTWTDAGAYQSAGIAYPAGLKSLVGFAYPAIPGGMPIVTKNSNITITIPDKIFAIVLSSDTNTSQKLLTINSPGDVILAPGEFLYVDISNLIISHGNYDALSALNHDYLIIGYNSYGSLTGPWANYQIEQISRINTSLASWAYPIFSETVTIEYGSNFTLSVGLPSAVMMATDYQRLQSVKFTSLISKLTLSNGNKTVTLNNNDILILNVDKQTIAGYDAASLAQLSDHYILLGVNHYGNLKGPWGIYQPSDKLADEQSSRINTSLASWAYPIVSETVSITYVTDSILSVKLPSAVMVATDYKRLQSLQFPSLVSKVTLSNGNGTVTLNNNGMLVLNVDKQTIDCYDAESLAKLSDHYILLAVNHYGNLKGPWSIYQPSDKLVNDNNYLPKYYFDNNYISDKIKAIRQNSRVTTGTNFAYFTDAHWGDNARQQGKLLNYITQNTSVETTIFGGDIPRAYGTQADAEADGQTYLTLARSLKHPLYGMHGNHDMTIKTDGSTDTGYTAPQIDQYDILNRGNELIQHGVQNKNYYYLDNPIQKVRYIIIDDWEGLDTSTYWGVKAGITQQQLDWLLTTALNVDGYTFIVLTHAPSDSNLTAFVTSNNVVQQLLVAINNKGQFNYDQNGISGSADFTKTTNHVAMHLCGHNHSDESNVADNVLSVSTMCDALYNDDPKYTTVRSARTINEQCINVISIDTTTKTIKMVRIGAGNDRSFNY